MPEKPANLPAQSYTNLGWRWDGMAVIHFGEGSRHHRCDLPILRAASTEQPFTGEYVDTEDEGMYVCAGCRNKLFSSETKFYSGSGWPSFCDVISQGDIDLRDNTSYGMQRAEIICAR